MNTLTNEQKDKVFAMYAPCMVMYGEDGPFMLEYSHHEAIINAKLIIKPISEISDDDAVELLKIACWHPQIKDEYEDIICDLHVERILRMQECVKIKYSLICFEGYFLIGTLDNMMLHFEMQDENEENPEPIWQSYRMVDKIRDLGYMVPYMGIDIYEAGIAIKPTDING